MRSFGILGLLTAGLWIGGCRTGSELPQWVRPAPVRGSIAQQRNEAHRVLDAAASQDDGVHDACGALISIGTNESIPHLIQALKVFPDEEPKAVICTWMHCVHALEKITKAKPGYSYTAWSRWAREQAQ